MESSKVVFAIYRNPPKEKPGMFRTYKNAAIALAGLLASMAIMLVVIMGAIELISSHPRFTASLVFATGLVCVGVLMARQFWADGRWSRVWGITLLLLIVANAINVLAGVAR